MLGTVTRRKGTDVFVAAASELLEHRDDLEFRIVGPLPSGPEARWAQELLEAARGRGISHRVVADSEAELAQWDVFVLPSREDPFPLAVLEAMVAGLPIVASGVDGIPEQLGRDSGLLIPVGDAHALSEALLKLVEAPDQRRALGHAARERARTQFSLAGQAALLDATYRRAARLAVEQA